MNFVRVRAGFCVVEACAEDDRPDPNDTRDGIKCGVQGYRKGEI